MSLTDHHSALADALAATRPPRSIGPRTAASLARGTRTYERRRARSECPRQCRSSSDLPLGSIGSTAGRVNSRPSPPWGICCHGDQGATSKPTLQYSIAYWRTES